MTYERPATLKKSFFHYIEQRFQWLSKDEVTELFQTYGYTIEDSSSEPVVLVLESPAAFLFHDYHLFEKPDELTGTFIEFEDGKPDAGITYFIDKTAARAIALVQRSAILQRINDGQLFLVPVERIRHAFQNHCSIDYKEMN